MIILFFVRRSIDVLDSENQPGSGKIRTGSESGTLGLSGDVWHQKYENKKEGILNYLKCSFYRILKISLRLMYKAQNPVFGLNWILTPSINTCHLYKKIVKGWIMDNFTVTLRCLAKVWTLILVFMGGGWFYPALRKIIFTAITRHFQGCLRV